MKKIILIFFSLAISLFLAEIILTRFFPQKTYSSLYKNAIACFDQSETTVFTLKPNCPIPFVDFETKTPFTTKTNSLGYRGEDFPLQKPPGEKRILMEGDSFILGFGVRDEQIVSILLEKQLGSRVINAGYVGGFGPDGYFLHLKNEGLKLTPDLVIFSVFVYNDLTDLYNDDWIGTGKYGEPQKVVSQTTKVSADGYLLPMETPFIYTIPVIRESQTAILVYDGIKKGAAEAKYLFEKVKFKISMPVIPSGDAKDSNLPGPYINGCIFGELCHRRVLHLYDDLLTTIKASKDLMDGLYKDNKTHFLVLLIPADFQLYPASVKKYNDNGIPTDIAKITDPNPQKRIKAMLDLEKIDHLDLLPSFRQVKERLYFEDDGHWNSRGHEKAAQELVKWLKNRNYE